MNTLPVAAWFVGSNGNWFADINGSRYCIDFITQSAKPISGFKVLRNGVEIAGPSCVGAPAGFRTIEAAKKHAEWHGDMNPVTLEESDREMDAESYEIDGMGE